MFEESDIRHLWIKEFTPSLYATYDVMRGIHKNDLLYKFWDVVVLTASDEEQKLAYKMQIDEKKKNREVFRGVDYHVFADPVGPKIGCGGATMNAIFELNKIYGNRIEELFILIINAGGFSQRLPNASALGKIFMALPYGSPSWTLFDLKLASYTPFLKKMKPGIFHAASDTIEPFSTAGGSRIDDWNFTTSGMTAVAHPSPVEIGTTHGVFVVDNQIHGEGVQFLNCLEVLQKPSLETLRDKGAVMKAEHKHFTPQDFVYTDSCFFIDHEFVKKLLNFYISEMPLTCEIDAYGDFMRCMGPNSNSNFITDFQNVLTASPTLESTRERLFNCLHTSQLNVIALNQSEFFHLGTMREYLENFSQNGTLFRLLGWKRMTFSVTLDEGSEINEDCTMIHSLFENKVTTNASTIIEFCHFTCPVITNEYCILSNCSAFSISQDFNITIPPNLFVHTVPVKNKGSLGYVTIIFGIKDDIKKRYNSIKDIVYLGQNVGDQIEKFVTDDETLSLWNAKLFPCLSDTTNSLVASLKLVDSILNKVHDIQLEPSIDRYSASKVMNYKDVISMLNYRESLKTRISQHSNLPHVNMPAYKFQQ